MKFSFLKGRNATWPVAYWVCFFSEFALNIVHEPPFLGLQVNVASAGQFPREIMSSRVFGAFMFVRLYLLVRLLKMHSYSEMSRVLGGSSLVFNSGSQATSHSIQI